MKYGDPSLPDPYCTSYSGNALLSSSATDGKLRARERLRGAAPEHECGEAGLQPTLLCSALTAASAWEAPVSQPWGSAGSSPKTFWPRSAPASYLQACALRSNLEKRLGQSEKRSSIRNDNSNKSSHTTHDSKFLCGRYCSSQNLKW